MNGLIFPAEKRSHFRRAQLADAGNAERNVASRFRERSLLCYFVFFYCCCYVKTKNRGNVTRLHPSIQLRSLPRNPIPAFSRIVTRPDLTRQRASVVMQFIFYNRTRQEERKMPRERKVQLREGDIRCISACVCRAFSLLFFLFFLRGQQYTRITRGRSKGFRMRALFGNTVRMPQIALLVSHSPFSTSFSVPFHLSEYSISLSTVYSAHTRFRYQTNTSCTKVRLVWSDTIEHTYPQGFATKSRGIRACHRCVHAIATRNCATEVHCSCIVVLLFEATAFLSVRFHQRGLHFSIIFNAVRYRSERYRGDAIAELSDSLRK